MITEYLRYAKSWLHGTVLGNVPVLENSLDKLLDLFFSPITGNGRYHWIELVEAMILTGLVYRTGQYVQPTGGWRSFLHYCFPAKLYKHASSLVDYQLIILNVCFGYLFHLTWRINSVSMTALFTSGLIAIFGPASHWLEWTTPLLICVAVLVFLAEDLANYTLHYWSHKIPTLWALHKVHHSAEVLTPLTALRLHPLEYSLIGSWRAVVTSFVLAPFIYLFNGAPTHFEMFGIALTWVIVGALGDVLMHSHVWLSWGRTLNHVLFCPAMHQIHHSQAPQHWDRNLGALLAIWDWMFGTIYVPSRPEEITYGVYGESRQPYPNAIVAWLRPLYEMVPMRQRIVHATARLFGPIIRDLSERMGLIRLLPHDSQWPRPQATMIDAPARRRGRSNNV